MTSIIITIAACIAALIVLYFLIVGTVFLIASKKAKAAFDAHKADFDKGFDSDFFRGSRRF